ncbi:MAG: hypothetical protein V1934_02265 [Methanobacteriota archaeon]
MKVPNPFENPKPGECWTERGAKYFRYAFVILSVILILSAVSSFFISRELSKASGTVVESPELIALVAADMILGSLQIGLGALMSLLLLLGLVGFYTGRKEFGEKHEKNVKRAMVTIVFAIGFIAASFALLPQATSGGYEFTDGQVIVLGASDTNIDGATVFNTLLSGVMVLIGLVCITLFLYFFIVELSSQQQKANIVGAAGVIIVSAIVWQIILSYLVMTSDIESAADILNVQAIAILLFIPIAVGLSMMAIAYNGVFKRIKNREIKPKLPEVVSVPPITSSSVPCAEMSPVNVSSILASAHPLVEEIVRLEYKIRMPLTWIIAIIYTMLICWFLGIWVGLVILAITIVLLGWTLWGFKAYQTKYQYKPMGQVTVWHILYWRTHLRNAQDKSYEVKDYYPYVVSDTLLMITDIKGYFEYKIISAIVFVPLLLVFFLNSTLPVSDGNGPPWAMWIAAIGFIASTMFIDLAIWGVLRSRFKDVRKRLETFKSNIDAFWRAYG